MKCVNKVIYVWTTQVPKKGDFPVSRIRIVEKLDWSFKKGKYWFQVRIILPFVTDCLENHDHLLNTVWR